MISVKLPGGKIHCNLCNRSVRETFWASHEAESEHVERVRVWEAEEHANRQSEESASSSSSSDEEADEFRQGQRSQVIMPELIPIQSVIMPELDEVTALELNSDVRESFVTADFFDETPVRTEVYVGGVEDRRSIIESTIQEGLERQVKKPRKYIVHDEDEDDWRSKSI